MVRRSRLILATLGAAALVGACAQLNSGVAGSGTSFFVTSANPGTGADFGGLAGADRYCQALGTKAGAGQRTWRAYLSATANATGTATNARDRIGSGPWQNAKGAVVARNVEDLHGTANNLNKQTALSEMGEPISGRGDAVNMHDILTGSSPEGRAVAGTADTTCGNWTQSGPGSALVGHHDRMGLTDDAPAKSWNSSHASRGCGMEALKSSGGAGLLYCFAVN